MPDGSARLTPAEYNKALIEDIGGFAGDPLAFVLYAFPWGESGTPLETFDGPHEWQEDLLCDIRDGLLTPDEAIQIATASGHGIGKSACVAMIVCWAMSTMPHCRGVVTAGTENQLRTKTQPEIAKWFRMMINAHWFDVTATKVSSVEHPTSWRIDFIPWSENNPESFAGLHNMGRRILVIVDEASQVADIIWETLRGALTDEHTEIIFLVFGNPTRNTGEFRMCFGRNRKRWVTRQIDSRDVPGTNKALIAQWIEDYGEDSDFVRVRVRGVFPRAGDMQLIASDVVEDARARSCEPLENEPIVLGVDVARGGDDQSVVAIRQGRDSASRPWRRYNMRDTMALASEVAQLAHLYRADAIFVDATGIGAGVYDRLAQLSLPAHCQVYEINFGQRADAQWLTDGIRAANKRAEMWWNMAEWLKRGAIPDEQQVEDDLIGVEYGYNRDSAVQLEKKEDMKKRGLSSPDNGDALALTFAYQVAPKQAEADAHDWKRRHVARSRDATTGY
ncbi:MAG: terminase [Pseudomonadota bacterium]